MVLFRGRGNRWQGGSSSVMLDWQVKEKRSCKLHNTLPPTTSDPALVCSAAANFVHAPHFSATYTKSLLSAELQNACRYLNTASPLYHHGTNKGSLIKSSWMSGSHGIQGRGGQSLQCQHRALSSSWKNVPRNFGCVSKCDKVDSTSREETAHSNQTQRRRIMPWGESSLTKKELIHKQVVI